MERTEFQISFGGLCIGFTADFPMVIPVELQPFLTKGGVLTDSYHICQICEPLTSEGQLLCRTRGITAYDEKDGSLLIFGNQDTHKVLPGCRLRNSGEHSLYVTKSMVETFAEGSRFGGIINGEELLLRHDALLLHSSLVCHKGRGILFSGPCCIGKSTQANLWNSTFGDKIINGDRAVIRLTEKGFYAGGSPWCGSSGIYCSDFIPIEAIVLLRQGTENSISPADSRTAFRELYCQCIVHGWDRAFVNHLCDLLQGLIGQVPIYCLTCLPDASAVILTEKTVFSREENHINPVFPL